MSGRVKLAVAVAALVTVGLLGSAMAGASAPRGPSVEPTSASTTPAVKLRASAKAKRLRPVRTARVAPTATAKVESEPVDVNDDAAKPEATSNEPADVEDDPAEVEETTGTDDEQADNDDQGENETANVQGDDGDQGENEDVNDESDASDDAGAAQQQDDSGDD